MTASSALMRFAAKRSCQSMVPPESILCAALGCGSSGNRTTRPCAAAHRKSPRRKHIVDGAIRRVQDLVRQDSLPDLPRAGSANGLHGTSPELFGHLERSSRGEVWLPFTGRRVASSLFLPPFQHHGFELLPVGLGSRAGEREPFRLAPPLSFHHVRPGVDKRRGSRRRRQPGHGRREVRALLGNSEA